MQRRTTIVGLTLVALAAPAGVLVASPVEASGITFIGFDDAPSKCFFADTTPLRGRYAAAKFSGSTADNGGAILDVCGGWTTPPRTGDRFLAFNSAVTYTDGGVPTGPETIKLPTTQKTVAIWVSQQGSEAASFKLTGKRAGKTITSTTATTSTSDYVQLKLHTKKGFDTVVLTAVVPDGNWTADDLTMTS